MKPLSYSSISQYLNCPLKYKFLYIDKLPKAKKPSLSFGDSLHKALCYFYSLGVPQPPSLDGLLRFYQENWDKEGYKDENEEKQYFMYGEQILTNFYNKHINDFHIPFTVEKEFNIEVEGIPLTGKIDRIEKLSDKIEVIDYKSNKDPFTLSNLKRDFQLSMYQIGAEQSFGLKVEKLTFYHLRSQTPFSVEPHSEKQINTLRKQVIEVADGIQKERFEPQKNRYCPCEFSKYCPHFKHLYMLEEEKKSTNFPEVNIEELVDEYGELKNRYKELDKREAELKEIFKKYFEEKGIKTIATERHQIFQSLMKKYEYNEDKVRHILEPLHLLDKVLRLDEKLLTTFLEDPVVPAEVKKELILARELKEIIQIRYGRIRED